MNLIKILTFKLWVTLTLMGLLSACGSSGGDRSDGTNDATVPDAPTMGAAEGGNSRASVSFTAPGSNGGAVITTYVATCSAGGESVSASAAASPIVVAGLTNGSVYSCTVTASNSVGISDSSAIATVTPAALALTDIDFDIPDWTEASHSKDVDPNFSEVFDDTLVKRFDFVVSPERWQAMLDDMTDTYGSFGQSGGPGLLETDEDPIFVPADVYYNGTQWYRVGIRFKGNSSLQGSWSRGILKLSFKMDFDEFEDDYPQIDNQRFYGFKKFSLKNNFDDRSQLREKVAADVFAKAGLAVSHTAFYTLYVDHGNGPEYFGLYTLVEEVDGEVLDTQFVNDAGNLYKPEDLGASFIDGTFAEEYFEKKTNEDEADWSDVQALFAALHDTTATTDPAAWRANLESIFDVDGFLKYLAVNGIIQNWDTYGRMTHNFYLYNNPETSKLTWIPWDNNEALQTGKQGGSLDLDFGNLSANSWPLIEIIYADEIYKAQYDYYLLEVISDAFETSTTQMLYDQYSSLIEPYATTELSGYSFLNGANDFSSAVSTLKTHAANRATAVNTYLGRQ
ncbi:MAG: CotH kinase family protein [Gammaproteobacteria bacterium]